MSFVIPSVFTAVNKFSGPLKSMGADVQAFASKAEAGIARSERAFKKFTPTLSHMAHEIIEAFTAVAIAQKLMQGIEFSFEAVEGYENKLVNLKATTGLTGEAFEKFNETILDVAKSSKRSALDVADVFTIVAKANPDLLDNAEAIGQISAAAILAAKATGQELGPTTQSLTNVMTQMGIKAEEAAGFVDILAAASKVGKYPMLELADGITQFSATAKLMHMSLAEDTALLQLSSTFRKTGEGATDSGAHISKFLMKLEGLNRPTKEIAKLLGHAGVSTKLLSSPTATLTQKLTELKKIGSNGALLDKIFGARQAEFAKGLLSHADGLEKIIDKTKEKGAAEEMAAERESTLTAALDRLKAAWINMLVGNQKATGVLTIFMHVVEFVTDHLEAIVKIGGLILGFFALWKTALIVGRIALVSYNVVLGIMGALSGEVAISVGSSTIALGAYRMVLGLATAAQWLLNAALLANPIGLIVVGIAALIAVIALIINKWNEWGAALAIFLGPLGMVISLVQAFRRNWDMIGDAFKNGGILAGLKAIGKTLLDAVLMPLQQILSLIGKFTGADWATNAAASIAKFRDNSGTDSGVDEDGNPLTNKGVVDTRNAQHKAMIAKYEQTNNAKVGITIDNKSGQPVSASGSGQGISIKTTSTMPMGGGGASW